MAKKYNDFDEDDQGGMFDQIFGIISNRRREFAIVSVVAAVLVLGLIVWDSYPDSAEQAAAESVPIVRADAGEYKTAPDNPGGMESPYRDSTVFSSNENTGGTENILEDNTAEAPLPREELFAGLNTETPKTQAPAATNTATPPAVTGGEVEDTVAMNKVESVQPPSNDALVNEAIGLPPLPAETASAPEPVAKVEEPKIEEPKVAETVKAAKTEPAAGSVAAKAVTPGTFYIQLASVKDSSGASGEYKKMQVKYPSLSGVNFRTEQADLGAKGTFHRIQAGPMSKDSAASICKSVKAKGGSCLVVGK